MLSADLAATLRLLDLCGAIERIRPRSQILSGSHASRRRRARIPNQKQRDIAARIHTFEEPDRNPPRNSAQAGQRKWGGLRSRAARSSSVRDRSVDRRWNEL